MIGENARAAHVSGRDGWPRGTNTTSGGAATSSSLKRVSKSTTSRTGKLVMGILALIAEFENDIRRERQLDGIAKAKERGVRFGVQPKLTEKMVKGH